MMGSAGVVYRWVIHMQSTEKRIGIHGSLVDESRYTYGIMVTGAPVSVVMINETYYAVLSYFETKKNIFGSKW